MAKEKGEGQRNLLWNRPELGENRAVMEKILVSACLLGQKCRYDGRDNERDYFAILNRYFDLVPFCPEIEGGLPCPRPRSEIKGSQVISEKGKNVTRQFEKGAEKALEVCRYLGITRVILKQDSPSCGNHFIHDGSFKGKKIPGKGITARLLEEKGIEVLDEEEGKAFLDAYLAHLEAKPEYKEPEPKPEPEPKEKEFPSRGHNPERTREKARIHGSVRQYERTHKDGQGKEGKPYGKKPFGKKPFDKNRGPKKPYGKKPFGKKPFKKKED